MRAVVTVIGKDRTGIIYAISKVLAEANVNIEDISQTVMQEFFAMIMLVDLNHMTGDFKELKAKLESVSADLGMSIHLQHEEIFDAMHTI